MSLRWNPSMTVSRPRRSPVVLLGSVLFICGMAAPALGVGGSSPAAGHAVLGSALQLKAYYYAYSGAPPAYREFGGYAGDQLQLADGASGTAIKPSVKAQIDKAVAAAKRQPAVMLDLKQIALHQYDASARAFPMDNRLFVQGMKFYFDVSPFHYRYDDVPKTDGVPCVDAGVVTKVDEMVKNYRQFNIRLYGRVKAADRETKSVTIHLTKFELLDDHDQLLMSQAMGD